MSKDIDQEVLLLVKNNEIASKASEPKIKESLANLRKRKIIDEIGWVDDRVHVGEDTSL